MSTLCLLLAASLAVNAFLLGRYWAACDELDAADAERTAAENLRDRATAELEKQTLQHATLRHALAQTLSHTQARSDD